jgi:hypothetical protein
MFEQKISVADVSPAARAAALANGADLAYDPAAAAVALLISVKMCGTHARLLGSLATGGKRSLVAVPPWRLAACAKRRYR